MFLRLENKSGQGAGQKAGMEEEGKGFWMTEKFNDVK